MKWMLVERRPDTIVAAGEEKYLGSNDTPTQDPASAARFETRQAAETHRRRLKHPYNWVAISASD